MENMTTETVDMMPKANHDAMMARMERMNNRMFVLTIVLIICLLGTNIGWLVYESQYEDVVTTTLTQEGEGDNNYIGNDGSISYGEVKTDDNQNQNTR